VEIQLTDPYSLKRHTVNVDGDKALFFFGNAEKTEACILTIIIDTILGMKQQPKATSYKGEFHKVLDMVQGREVQIIQ